MLIICLPIQTNQFIMEVDTSVMGVGHVLFQRSSKDNKIHPSVYLSRKFFPAEGELYWGLRTTGAGVEGDTLAGGSETNVYCLDRP